MAKYEYNIVHDELTTFFVNNLNIDVPSPTTDLFTTGILDSQNFIELLLHLEQKYDAIVRLDNIDIENFRSIEMIVNLLCERLNSVNYCGYLDDRA